MSLGEVDQGLHGRDITPLQVFADQDQLRFSREPLGRFGELAYHALLAASLDLTLERVAFMRLQQSRHLHQPQRGIATQDGQHMRPTCFPTQLPQRLQEG